MRDSREHFKVQIFTARKTLDQIYKLAYSNLTRNPFVDGFCVLSRSLHACSIYSWRRTQATAQLGWDNTGSAVGKELFLTLHLASGSYYDNKLLTTVAS